MTPTESGWSGDADIGVYSPEHTVTGVESQLDAPPDVQPLIGTSNGKKRDFDDMRNGWTDAEKDALTFLEVLSKSKLRGKGKGKARAEEDGSQGTWRRAIWNHMLKKS
jgi:hypothetical protein